MIVCNHRLTVTESQKSKEDYQKSKEEAPLVDDAITAAVKCDARSRMRNFPCITFPSGNDGVPHGASLVFVFVLKH